MSSIIVASIGGDVSYSKSSPFAHSPATKKDIYGALIGKPSKLHRSCNLQPFLCKNNQVD